MVTWFLKHTYQRFYREYIRYGLRLSCSLLVIIKGCFLYLFLILNWTLSSLRIEWCALLFSQRVEQRGSQSVGCEVVRIGNIRIGDLAFALISFKDFPTISVVSLRWPHSESDMEISQLFQKRMNFKLTNVTTEEAMRTWYRKSLHSIGNTTRIWCFYGNTAINSIEFYCFFNEDTFMTTFYMQKIITSVAELYYCYLQSILVDFLFEFHSTYWY